MARWWAPIAIFGFSVNGLFMVYLVQRSSNPQIELEIGTPKSAPLHSNQQGIRGDLATKLATTSIIAEHDHSPAQTVLLQTLHARAKLRPPGNFPANATNVPSALSLSSGHSAAHAAALAVANAVAKIPLSRHEPIHSTETFHKDLAPAKRQRLVFIHIESSVTAAGSSRRSLIRETWLKFADTRWVNYRFFLSSKNSKAHPTSVRKTIESIRHEKRASVVKLGYSDIVLRGNNSVIGHGLAWEQWSILWADLELALCTRYKYYLRITDDSMLCIPQLLAELSFRPELSSGPIFWGKFWCTPSVSVRPEEHFMLFSVDIVRFLVFDWNSEAHLIPYHSERTLSQNFGFFTMFLNVSLYDDRARLTVAQDIIESTPRRSSTTALARKSSSNDVDKSYLMNPPSVERGKSERNVTSEGFNNYESDLLDSEKRGVKHEGDITNEASDFNVLANTTTSVEVSNESNVSSKFDESSHRGICDRLIFLLKPGDRTAMNAMANGLSDRLKGLNWSDTISYNEDSYVQTKSTSRPNGLVRVNKWQLNSLYRRHESVQSNRVDDASKNVDVLQAPCANAGLAQDSSSMLVSQFGARHRRSVEASLESLSTVKAQIPMISAGFRSNQNSNPYKNPPPMKQNFLYSHPFQDRNKATKPTILRENGRRPGTHGMPPLQQKNSVVQKSPQLEKQQTAQKRPLHEEYNIISESKLDPGRDFKAPVAKAMTSTQTAVQRFRSSLGSLQDLTPAGRNIKVNAAVERTLKKLGLGDVKGSPEELLELAAVAAEKDRSPKSINNRKVTSAADIGRSAADEIMAQLPSATDLTKMP